MLRSLLLWGMLAGLIGGVLTTGFAEVVGEPQVARAIQFESQQAKASGEAEMPELVSRGVQRSVGLVVAAVIYGTAVGGLFALAFAGVYGRIGRRVGVTQTAAWLAAACFGAVFLVPFLKYPANPPAVGDPDTIGKRTALYFVMIAISILAAVAGARLGRWVADRWNWSTPAAALGGIGAFLVIVIAAGVALPSVNEVPANFPAVTLWRFRVAAVGTQMVLWVSIGLVFALAARRVMARRSAALAQPI
jgi:hypothetical protein